MGVLDYGILPKSATSDLDRVYGGAVSFPMSPDSGLYLPGGAGLYYLPVLWARFDAYPQQSCGY